MSNMSKYLYDTDAWEQAGELVGKIGVAVESVATPGEKDRTVREVLAEDIFRTRQAPTSEQGARVPQGSLFWARAMANSPQVKGWAAHYRKAAFEKTEAPFNSMNEARTWLNQQRRDSKRAQDRDYKRARHAERVAWEAKPATAPGTPVHISVHTLYVDFPGKEGRLETLYAHTRQLTALARGAQQIADTTGWHPAAATAFLLTGVFPVPAWGPLTLHRGAGVPWLEIRVYPGALNPTTFRAILRRALARMAGTMPRGNDAALLDVIQELGPPPEGKGHGTRVGLTQYWQRVAQRWNQLNRSSLKTDALRKRWERLQDRTPNLANLLTGEVSHGTTRGKRSRHC
jgi:hypothetical protein